MMRGVFAAAALGVCAALLVGQAIAQTSHHSEAYSHRSGLRPGDDALTCPQLQAEYDAAVSDAAMSAEYSGGGDEGDGGSSTGSKGPSLASMGSTALSAAGGLGGGMGGMGSGASVAMQGMAMGMGGGQGSGGMIPSAGDEGTEGGATGVGGGRRPSSWANARVNRVRALARTKNCGLIQRSAGWERRTPPPLAPSAPLDTSPEAMDGGELPDSEGGLAPDSTPEPLRD